MYKLVVFDLDGTLADTLADLAAAMNFGLSNQGLRTYPTEDYRHFVGNGIDNLVRVTMAEYYDPDKAADVKTDFYAYYADHCLDCTSDYPGVGELLVKLSRDGIDTAVISNKPDRFVPVILERIYPRHSFRYAWGQRVGIARKPDPQALNELISLYGCEKGEVLYVGDSNVDVIFARGAGVDCCGVSWGFRGADELREAGADYIADTADELYDIVRSRGKLRA